MIDTKQILDRAKANAPGIAVGALGGVLAIVALSTTGGTTVIETPAPVLGAPVLGSPKARTWWIPTPHEGQETRLVSCGRTPIVAGDDGEGTITTDASHCTLLLAAHWPVAPTCVVSGGTVLEVKCLGMERGKATDCVSVELAVTGRRLTYRCGVQVKE